MLCDYKNECEQSCVEKLVSFLFLIKKLILFYLAKFVKNKSIFVAIAADDDLRKVD
mgnify:CR=1 FL=1